MAPRETSANGARMNQEDLRKLKFLTAMKGLKVTSNVEVLGVEINAVATVDDLGFIAVHAKRRQLVATLNGVRTTVDHQDTYLHSVYVDLLGMLRFWELVDD